MTSPPTAAPVAAATPAPVALATPEPTPGSTPGPTANSTSSRGLDLTSSPTAEATTTVESGANSGSVATTASSVDDDTQGTTSVAPGEVSSDGMCFTACFNDEDCAGCITLADENEDDYAECLGEAGDSNCDFLNTGLCCMAALSGNDCAAMDAYDEFISCYFETIVSPAASSTCLIEDFDCSAVSGFGTGSNGDSNGAGAAAVETSYLAAVLTSALGVAAVVAAGLQGDM